MTSTPSIRVEFARRSCHRNAESARAGNPFDGTFTRDFKQAVSDLWDMEACAPWLLRAEGKNFSFGGDLKEFYPQRAELGPLVRRWTADLHMGLQRAWQLPVPSWRRFKASRWVEGWRSRQARLRDRRRVRALWLGIRSARVQLRFGHDSSLDGAPGRGTGQRFVLFAKSSKAKRHCVPV